MTYESKQLVDPVDSSDSFDSFDDGPSQRYVAPDRLVGKVVDWHDGGAIHGISVLDDLAVHFSPHETLLLGLTGRPPTIEQGRAFAVALTWISAAHVGTAPTHAAVLARISGAPTANLMSIIVLAAASEAEYLVTKHQALLEWLAADPASRPDSPTSNESDSAEFVGVPTNWRERLRNASGLDLTDLDSASDTSSAALIVFHVLGLTRRHELVVAWTWSRMLGSLAESLTDQPLDMRSYPLRIPAFDYREGP